MNILVTLATALVSIIAHELAHGYMAHLEGDETPRRLGRLTWNPLAHLELFRSVLLPLGLYAAGLPIIGGAKPMPIDVGRLGRGALRRVAAAGVVVNVVLAGVCYALHFTVGWQLNLILAAFNALPIPPLDGWVFLKTFFK